MSAILYTNVYNFMVQLGIDRTQAAKLIIQEYDESYHRIPRGSRAELIAGHWPRDNSHRPPMKKFPRLIVEKFPVLHAAVASTGDSVGPPP